MGAFDDRLNAKTVSDAAIIHWTSVKPVSINR